MGNSASAGAARQQQQSPFVVGGPLPTGRDREQAASSVTPAGQDGRNATARYVAPNSTPQQRIVVDIRSAQLDKDYKVYITQDPRNEFDTDLRAAWNGLQAVGGILITILTIQKLWEDIQFVRLLRRELSSVVGSLTDAGGAADAAGGQTAGARAPRPRGTGGFSSPSSSSGGGGISGHLDLTLSELSDLLGGGTRSSGAAAAAAGGTSVGRAGDGGAQQQRHPRAEDPSVASVIQKETTWASISGLTGVKILLQEATVLPTLRPDLFQGIRQPPKALLLFGPPGTGKTLLARAVAAESRATFLPVTGSSVLSMWYGQSEQNVKALFEKARRRQPAIIFIDEVDSLLGKRSAGGPRDSTPDKRVTNEFLAFIDGIQTQQPGQQLGGGGATGDREGAGTGGTVAMGDTRIVVIAATNTPWDLDEAALSRFSRRIYVPLPDKATREGLMRKAMEGVGCNISDEEWQRLAERCDKYSGRDLVQVCREAAMRPLRELWGRRLLEGSVGACSSGAAAGGVVPGPAGTSTPHPRHVAAQQQLTELVAKSLAGALASSEQQVRQQQQGGGRAGGVVGQQGSGQGAGALAAPSSGNGNGGPPRRRWRWLWRWGGLGRDKYAACKKQARRELEKWKRRHGATWCDVDAVMQQAEARLAEMRQQQQGSGQKGPQHAGHQGPERAGPQCASQREQQGQGHPQPGQQPQSAGQEQESSAQGDAQPCVTSGLSDGAGKGAEAGAGGTPLQEQQQQQLQDGQTEQQAAGARQGAGELAPLALGRRKRSESGEGSQGGDVEQSAGGPVVARAAAPAAAATSACGSHETSCMSLTLTTPAAGGVGAAGQDAVAATADMGSAMDVDRATSRSRRATVDGSAAASTGDANTGLDGEGAGTPASAAASTPVAKASSAPDDTAAQPSAPCQGGAVCNGQPAAAPARPVRTENTAPVQPATTSASAGASAAGRAKQTAAASTSPKRPAGRDPTPGAAATSSSSTAATPPVALSLDDLLKLPVDRVRPVTAADMETALQVISCTEMDQSARYTEWDEQYGSGANASGRLGGGRGSRWMSMYV